MRNLIVKAGPFTFDARFEEAAAPKTCAAFQAAMPFEGQIVHGVGDDGLNVLLVDRQPVDERTRAYTQDVSCGV